MRNRGLAVLTTVAGLLLGGSAAGQKMPRDLTLLPPVPTSYIPKKTAWGDADFRGTWRLDQINDMDVPLERAAEQGRRVWQTDEEFTRRLDAAKKLDAGVGLEGSLVDRSQGLANWARTSPDGRRTSMIVDPADGRLPPLTPAAAALARAGKSSWVKGEPIDWISDLDTFDRCITRGLPSIMIPTMANNAVRVFQAPGFVALKMETLETRIIPVGPGGHRPEAVRSWMGDSRGRWQGNTLVIETTNIIDGDGTGRDPKRLAASPVSPTYQPAPMPVSRRARLVERLTMTGPKHIAYEATYSDPEVFTAPWTVRLDWPRDDKYQLYEFACHEGNELIRTLVSASQARKNDGAPAAQAASK